MSFIKAIELLQEILDRCEFLAAAQRCDEEAQAVDFDNLVEGGSFELMEAEQEKGEVVIEEGNRSQDDGPEEEKEENRWRSLLKSIALGINVSKTADRAYFYHMVTNKFELKRGDENDHGHQHGHEKMKKHRLGRPDKPVRKKAAAVETGQASSAVDGDGDNNGD